jgi:nicotinate-nucleotide adenylyltransferase
VEIALFGGAFDPPHLGHLALAKALANSELFDEIWIIPSGSRPDKKYLFHDEQRISLVKALIEDLLGYNLKCNLRYIDIEINNPDLIGTVELLDELKSRHKNFIFTVVIGSDLILQLKNWRHHQRLMKECNFITVNRPRFKVIDRSIYSAYLIKELECQDLIDISSSKIRSELVKPIVNWSYLATIVPAKVFLELKRMNLKN